MGGSASRPHSREKVICQVLTYCHLKGFVNKHLGFFFFFGKFQRKGAYLLNPGAKKKPIYVAALTQPVSYILRSMLAHLYSSHSMGIQIECRMVFG